MKVYSDFVLSLLVACKWFRVLSHVFTIYKCIRYISETCGGNTNLTLDNIHQLEKMLTDTVFLVPIDRKVKTFAEQLSIENLPVYYYRYRYVLS